MSKKIIKRLEQYADVGDNVLLIGDTGVGKTSIIQYVFGERFKNWKYFNGATMNPWVDFVGIPDRESGITTNTFGQEENVKYLTMVQQKDFALDQVEAIFMDELNRAKEQTRNAIMELIQFKSINGKKFHNLKLIWAAINEGEDYDVERLDKATKDRFHVHIFLPSSPDNSYFIDKYEAIGEKAISWWSQLPENSRKMISPRRLEIAIKQYQRNFEMKDVLFDLKDSEIHQFKNIIKAHSPSEASEEIFKNNQNNKAKKMLNDQDFFNSMFIVKNSVDEKIKKHNDKWLDFWVPLMDDESLIRFLENNVSARTYVFKNIERYKNILLDYYKVNSHLTKLGNRIHEQMIKNQEFSHYIESNMEK